MPRHEPTHRPNSHRRILTSAGRVVREDGLGGSLNRIMSRLRMTKGGFYHHFRSKDVLLHEVLTDIFRSNRETWRRRLEGLSGPPRVAEMLDRYLSEEHLLDVSNGCVIPAVLSDLSRVPPARRTPFDEYHRWLLEEMQPHMGGPAETSVERASAILSLAFGALASARATGDPETRKAILSAARDAGRALCSPPLPEDVCPDKSLDRKADRTADG